MAMAAAQCLTGHVTMSPDPGEHPGKGIPTGVSKPIEPVSFLESGGVHQVYHLQFGQRLRLQ